MKETNSVWTTGDLMDFEAQMARDETSSEQQLDERDRGRRPHVHPDSSDRAGTLKRWLDDRRKDPGVAWPSDHWDRTLRFLNLLALLIGLISGTLVMQGLLRYNGEAPVNIMPFLGLFVFFQILFLSAYLLRGFLQKLLQKPMQSFGVGLLGDILRRTLDRRLDASLTDKRFNRPFWERLYRLHRPLFQWHAARLLQLFAMAFFASSLGNFLISLILHDYGFGWGSTLVSSADALHRVLSFIALPFAWLHSDLVPSAALVDASRFARFEGSYANPTIRSAETGAFWPFLTACIITYALLPRLVLWISTERSLRRYLARMTFDDFMSSGLWQRLTRPDSGWQSTSLDPKPVLRAAKSLSQKPGDKAIVIRWRDCPLRDEDIRTFFAAEGSTSIAAIVDAVGRTGEQEAIAQLILTHKANEVLVVCDPWELPGEAMDRLRQFLKSELSDPIRMVFVPLEKTAAGLIMKGDKEAWAYAVGAFRDPYLGLFRTAKEAR